MKRLVTAISILITGLCAFPALAGDPLDKTAIKEIIREYLLNNPEIILEVQDALEHKQAEELAERQLQVITDQAALLYDSPYQIEMGNSDAEITIVEFFDYNCRFCQRAMTDMKRLLESDGEKVRFVLKEFPVLGEGSIDSARVSLAFSQLMPQKIDEFHTTLLGAEGIKDGDMAQGLAIELGVDEGELLAEMEKPYIIDALSDVYRLAEELGITGTPSYVVGNNVVFGAVGYEGLKANVDQIISE